MGIVTFYLNASPILFNSTYLNGRNDVMKDSKGKSSRTPTSTTVFGIEILSLSIMHKIILCEWEYTKKCLNFCPTATASFSRHFCNTHFNPAPSDSSPTTSQIRNLCNVTILWRGSPIQSNKFYGTPSCTLCMRERIFLAK